MSSCNVGYQFTKSAVVAVEFHDLTCNSPIVKAIEQRSSIAIFHIQRWDCLLNKSTIARLGIARKV